jgi:pimeloyl-ACP methyl ester carboxylesterase
VPFVTAHGIRLAYELSGPAGGPACVLIHGWTGSIVEWAAVIRPLNDLGWRTLAIDGPGHGRSEAPAAREMYTMHALADLHHEVARVLGYSPAVVMGFSMGGAIAEEYALRHPRSVRGLVLLGSAGGDWIDEEAQAEIDEALPVAFSEGMGAVWERRARRLYPEELDRMSVEERARRREAFAATSAEGYVYTLHGLQEKRNTLGALTKLARPMLIVHGADDDASIIEAARRLHVTIPGSRYVVVPDAGHFAQDDNPDALNHGLASPVCPPSPLPETEQARHETGHAVQSPEQGADLVAGKDDRELFGALGADDPGQPGPVDVQHVPVKEQKGAERLVLGRSGDMAIDGQ